MTLEPTEISEEVGAIRVTRLRRAAVGLAFVLWFIGLLWAYQRAWGARFHPIVVQGPRIAIVLAILLACWVSGRFLLRLLRPTLAGHETNALSIAIGLVAFSFLWLALALTHILHPLVAWSLLGVGAAAGVVVLLRTLRARVPELQLSSATFPLLIAAAGVLVAVPMAFAPPTSTDALVYHLALPNWYIGSGGMIALPSYALAAFPAQMQMLYLWVLLLGQPVVAQLLHFAIGLVAVACVASWTSSIEPGGGRFSTAVLLTTPVILLNMSWAWADVATGLFVLVGTRVLLQLSETRERRDAIFAGILWGMALGLKYTVALYFVIAVIVAIWPLSIRRLRERLAPFALAGIVALALFSPYLIRNTIIYSNPTHPLGNELWGPRHEGPFGRVIDEVERRDQPIDYLRGIVSYTFSSQWVDDAPGPIFLLALPVLLLLPLGKARRIYAVGAAGMLLFSVAFGGSVRYQIPAFFLLAVPIGVWLSTWWHSGALKRALVVAVLLLPGISNLSILAYHNRELFDPTRVALGFEPEEQYLRRILKSYPIAEYINRQTPEDARILMIAEERLFYIDRPLIAGSLLDVSPARDLVRSSGSAVELGKRLRALGINYVFFDRGKFSADLQNGRQRPFWSDAELVRLRDFFTSVGQPVMRSGTSELYWVPKEVQPRQAGESGS